MGSESILAAMQENPLKKKTSVETEVDEKKLLAI
jgi:hypothetical protein